MFEIENIRSVYAGINENCIDITITKPKILNIENLFDPKNYLLLNIYITNAIKSDRETVICDNIRVDSTDFHHNSTTKNITFGRKQRCMAIYPQKEDQCKYIEW